MIQLKVNKKMRNGHELDKTMRMNYLFDFYQCLLTDKQKNYLERYYLLDESLSEIAESNEVSRQAVYDNIKRTDELLEDYESKLKLFQNFEQRQHIMNQLKQQLNALETTIHPSIINNFNQLIESLESIE